MLLGIGGWRLLRALGLRPEVCHLNEGHAAFAVLERARNFMEETGQPFEEALAVTRAGNLFTTHTAVAAGFDRFAPALIEQYLAGYAEKKLGITLPDLLALGRQNPADSSEPFNMAYLAIRGSGAVNGVSRLHGKVSRRLFLPLVSALAGGRSPHRTCDQRSPCAHLGLGIGRRSMDQGLRQRKRWLGTAETMGRDIRSVSDATLWQFRMAAVASLWWNTLANDCPWTIGGRLARRPEAIDIAPSICFDPNALTLGFARRFATYKRPNLLLHDPERLLRLLTNPQRPVQLIIAGKAHPADQAGQELIREWMHFIREPGRGPMRSS
jgi:starch phosphorylase